MEILKKKRIVMVITATVLPLIVFLFVGCKTAGTDESEQYLDSYDEAIDTLNNKIPTSVFLYGEDMIFRDDVIYTKIASIDEENLSSDKIYTVLIINDLEGNMSLTDEEIAFLKKKAENFNFYLYYCGTNLTKDLVKAGIFDKNTFQEGDLCAGYVTHEGERLSFGGIFTEKDQAVAEEHNIEGRLSEFIFCNVLECYRSNN